MKFLRSFYHTHGIISSFLPINCPEETSRMHKILNMSDLYISLRPEKGKAPAKVETCGEIWLLATTLKNAKMLTMVIKP